MKVLHLSAFDLVGGSARATYRIHQGIRSIDIDSQLVVQYKQSRAPTVVTAESDLVAKLRSTGSAQPDLDRARNYNLGEIKYG
jgi:hypothetical protein